MKARPLILPAFTSVAYWHLHDSNAPATKISSIGLDGCALASSHVSIERLKAHAEAEVLRSFYLLLSFEAPYNCPSSG